MEWTTRLQWRLRARTGHEPLKRDIWESEFGNAMTALWTIVEK